MKIFINAVAFCMLVISAAKLDYNNPVVGFDMSQILNARPVTTLTGNKLVSWKRGVDGNGLLDGYLTMSAALFTKVKDPHALPDNPVIPANSAHPEITLHYANADSVHAQAHAFFGEDSVSFSVAKAKYRTIFLALTSAEGASSIRVRFYYETGSSSSYFVVPDYYQDLTPNDYAFCYLVHNLGKWGPKNNLTEKDHHNIDLLNIPINPILKLKSIQIYKTKPGYLVLWAAAGMKS